MLNLLSKNNISLLRVINAVFILIVAIGTLLKYFSLKEIAEISNIVAILFFIFIASLMVMAFLIPFISKPLCKFFYNSRSYVNCTIAIYLVLHNTWVSWQHGIIIKKFFARGNGVSVRDFSSRTYSIFYV